MIRTKRSYHSMKQRCYNEKCKDYYLYGGRGIKVCDRWLESFENFLEDMGNRPNNTSLDRINPEKDYSPENCRWADTKTQSLNKRNSKYVTFNNETRLLIEFCEELNLHYNTVIERLRRHKWSIEKTLSTKTNKCFIKNEKRDKI